MSPYLAELVGTLLLVMLGNGVVANVVLTGTKGHGGSWIAITAGWALGVFVGVLTAGGLARVPALLDELGASVETDMTGLDLLRLSERTLRARPEHVHGLIIGHEHTEH